MFGVDDSLWQGWVVEFKIAVDMEEIKRNIWGVLIIGDRACFIGISNG